MIIGSFLKNIFLSLVFLSFSVFFSACQGNPSDEEVLERSVSEINPYQEYVEKMLSYRAISFSLYEDLKDKELLSGGDLDKLHKMLVRYMDTKLESAAYIGKYQYLIDVRDAKYTQKQRLELVMISLSAMLIRYDDYLLAYKSYEDNDKLRVILNTKDSAYGINEDTLQEITDTYNSLSQREDVKNMIDFYEDHISDYYYDKDPLFLYLRDLIQNSPSYKLGFGYFSSISLWWDSLWNDASDGTSGFFSYLFNGTSKSLGNTAGLVETRRGKLYEDANAAANIRAVIQPGDILMEKTPFRLTDKLIPGHWGHIAVYVGNEDELKALGLWDEPIVQAHKEEILAGKLIDEALRDGVQLNSIEHFLNVDDLAIMHYEGESLEAKKARILLTLRQLGKEYDFEYDVETSDKIVCSELVYITFIDVNWETDKLVGINTISPDNVAVKSLETNSSFSIPLLYHDGLEITENKVSKMAELLESAKE